MKARCRALGLSALLTLVFASVPAHAQSPAPTHPGKLPLRTAKFTWEPKTASLLTAFSYREVVDAEVRRKLQSGLPTVIVLRSYVFPDNAGQNPGAVGGFWQSCRIAFDVWNEVYRINISQPSGESHSVAINLEGVLRRCAEVKNLPVLGTMQPGNSYFLASTVEVNPVSQEMIEQIRRWVSRPPGSAAVTPGDSIFGSFVGLFVARIGKADASLAFRSQAFVMQR